MEIDFVLASPLHRRGKTFFCKIFLSEGFFGITSSPQRKDIFLQNIPVGWIFLASPPLRRVKLLQNIPVRWTFLLFLQNVFVTWIFLQNISVGWTFCPFGKIFPLDGLWRDFSSYFLQNLIQQLFIRIQKETFSM